MPIVSVIIVNYNGAELVIDCLKSLDLQIFRDFEVLIVDNGSSDCSATKIQLFLDGGLISSPAKLIALDSNLGFAEGNLKGLNFAVGKFIALLNNDTAPEKDWLLSLVRAMESEPGVGICASKIINHGTDIIDSAGDGFSSLLKGFKRGEGEKDSLYDKKEYVMGACAGAALYRREMLEEIGFLDEDFFLIHEDTDLNIRAQLAGWKAMYVPEAIIYHKVSSTIGVMSNTAIYYTLRNSEFVRIKNIPISVFIGCLPALICGTITEFFYFAVKHRHLRLYLKAKFDVLKMFPVMFRKRREIMKGKRANYSDIKAIITPVFEKAFFKNKLRKFHHD